MSRPKPTREEIIEKMKYIVSESGRALTSFETGRYDDVLAEVINLRAALTIVKQDIFDFTGKSPYA